MEDPRINEYRQSTFYQTKTSNEIKLNVAVEEADARNSGRDPMQPQILCSLRFNSGLWYWYSSLLLLQITRYIIPATSTHNTESALREGEAEGEFHE